MTARVILMNNEAAFALARRVLLSGAYDADAVDAAVEVLSYSPHDNDRATVRYMRELAPQMADMGQIDMDDTARDARQKVAFILCSMAVTGGVLGGVLMERLMTLANAGAW